MNHIDLAISSTTFETVIPKMDFVKISINENIMPETTFSFY